MFITDDKTGTRLLYQETRLLTLVNPWHIFLFTKYSKLTLVTSLQTNHVYSTLKRHGNVRLHVVSTWNKRGVFLGLKSSDVTRTLTNT